MLLIFLETLYHSSVSWDITLLYIFIWIFVCFGQKNPIKVQIFRLSTAHMKINQIPYVNFQATSQFSFLKHLLVSWHIIPLKFSNWNFICFGQKEPLQNIHNFGCSIESSPNTSSHFWNPKVRVYSNIASLFSVMKNNSSVFFSSNLIYFGQK